MKRNLILATQTCLFLLNFKTMATDLRYSLKDLEILEKNKSYREYLDHAKDILPSQRKNLWEKMTSNMGEGYLKRLVEEEDFTIESYNYVNRLSEWKILQNNEFFRLHRADFGVRYFTQCFQKSQNKNEQTQCMESLFSFWRKIPAGDQLALDLGNLLMTYGKSTGPHFLAQYWEIFGHPAKSKYSEFYCSQVSFKKAGLKKLFSLVTRITDKNSLKKKIQSYFHNNCLNALGPDLKKILKNTNHHFWPLAFKTLWATKSLNQEQLDFYQTFYFLNHHDQKGDTLTESWFKLKKLGLDYRRRQKVFEKLKILDPLPGKVFSKGNRPTLGLLHKNFPEYPDFYAKTCYQYLSGQKNFQNGNPTIQCKDLISQKDVKSLVDPFLKNKIENILNQ